MKNCESFWLWVGEHYILGFFLFIVALLVLAELVGSTYRFAMVLARGWPSKRMK